ncbi:MAG: tetratricopeptide repeat protein [Thermodesulfobacteriota bacterium]|nr:tetratricopeptide repeat protein [Thermodesulfobacteriota bacterium]
MTPLFEGDRSCVYRAWDNREQRWVAIKTGIDASNPDINAQVDAAIIKEAGILSRLSHPNILALYDLGELNSRPFLATELVAGKSLASFRGTIPDFKWTLQLVAAVAGALAYLHENGVFHLDIKPENILLDQSGPTTVPRLCDFGMAMSPGELAGMAVEKRLGGTVSYMAPEHALGKSIDERADIYSLGIVMFELLTGEKPFYAASPEKLAMQHITRPVPRPRTCNPALPPAIDAVVSTALAKEPDNRFPNMAAFIDALAKIPAPPAIEKESPYSFRDAAMYFQNNQFDRAIESCHSLIRRQPDHAKAHDLMGQCFLRQHQPQKALFHFKKAMRLDGPTLERLVRIAAAHCRAGNEADAVTYYQQALSIAPDNAAVHLDLGRLYLNLGQPGKAEVHFETVVDKTPESAAAHNSLGRVKQMLGKGKAAAIAFQTAVALAPEQPATHYNLAAFYHSTKKPDDALAHCRRALTLNPSAAPAHHLMGMILLEKAEPARAVRHLETALQCDPTRFMPLYDLARAYIQMNDYPAAESACRKLLQFTPNAKNAYLTLADIQEASGKTEDATASREIARRLQKK